MKFINWLKKNKWVPFAHYPKGILWTNDIYKKFTRELFDKFTVLNRKSKKSKTVSANDDLELLETKVENAIKSGKDDYYK